MAGIVSYGAYIPFYRLERKDIAAAWGGRPVAGERAVANWDEDSLTMGVEAARDCLVGFNPEEVEGLYFASTTSPFKEKQVAALIAAACDLKKEIVTADYGNSLRGGTTALRNALDGVKAGSARNTLVVVSDCRVPYPKSAGEYNAGDGAAAFLIGNENVMAEIEATFSLADEIFDCWREEGERFPHTWEDRFVFQEGYQRVMEQAILKALAKYGFALKDFTKVVFYGPDGRAQRILAARLGLEVTKLVGQPLFDSVGNTGGAFLPLLLVSALEEAKPGDRFLVANYGDGADVFILRTTEKINFFKRRGVKAYLGAKKKLDSYQRYLAFRRLIETEPSRVPPIPDPPTLLWREQDSLCRFRGSRCQLCGKIQFPIQRVCPSCRTKDTFEQVKLRERKATLYTFTLDHLDATTLDPPGVRIFVELEGEVRIKSQLTDCCPDQIKIGMPVEPTFRRFFPGGDIPTYAWKFRPERGKNEKE